MPSRALTKEETDLVAHMLEEIDAAQRAGKLTDWERNFIESVDDQFGRYGRLSDKQLDILKRIYEDRA